MNALPLTFSFLLIFFIIQSAFFKELPLISIEHHAFKEMLEFDREQHNLIEKRLNKSSRKQPRKHSSSSPHKRPQYFHPSGRVHLYALDTSHAYYSSFKQGASKLLELIYPMYSEKERTTILNTLLDAKAFTKDKTLTLEDFAGLNKNSSLLTTLWEGTAHYNVEKQKGIVPLTHIFSFDMTCSKKPIFFPKAHELVLCAFLGKVTSQQIIRHESAKEGVLIKKELFKLKIPHEHFHFTAPNPKYLLCNFKNRQQLILFN